MKVAFTFLLIIGLISCQAVISRNGKVQEMIDALKENEKLYDDVIGILEEKMKKDYDSCINSVKSLSCSDSQIWEQQRSKSSKNITNLKEKIRKHNRTIDALLQLNKQEVTKKNLTMVKLFPQIEKIKNDIELIENMLFLIEDTYLNLDTAGKSLLLLFDHEFEHPKAQQMQQSFIQLMSKHKSLFKADPPTKPAEGDKPAAEAKPAAEGDKPAAEGDQPAAEGEPAEGEKKEGDKVPLIDEDIFDGEADKTELEVGNLFQPSEEEQAAEITADEIPDGVDVQEHDQDRWGNTIEPLEDTNTEDLRIYEVREDFKKSIKEMGKIMHEQLKIVHDGLDSELDMRVQAVADLEKAIIDLHHKHAKQLVQIYIESKKLQQTIFELDDQVLSLDAQIFDCQNSDKRLEKCETRKGLDQVVLDDLKTEKSFNAGSLKELEKLKEFDDKNVYEPGPMEPDAAAIAAEEAQNAEAAKQAEVETKIQQRIHSIKDEEQEVQQELQDEEEKEQQLAEKHPELRGSVLPEHLAEVPEVMQSAVEQIPEAAQKLIQAKEQLIEKEEDSVLEQVDQELKGQDEVLIGLFPMEEELNFTCDPGALLFTDSNQLQISELNSQTLVNDFLKDLTLKNFKRFVKKLHSLPHPDSFETTQSTIELPAMKTVLPRFKKLPDKQVLTRWEQFAQRKGIRKQKKRLHKIWDERVQDWVPRWGYGSKAQLDEKFTPIIESQANDCPFEQRSRQKSLIHQKQKLNEAKNEQRKGRKRKDNQLQPAVEKKKKQKQQLEIAQLSTKSMGMFDKKVNKKEPDVAKKIKPKKVKDYVFSSVGAEKNRNLEILGLVSKNLGSKKLKKE